MIRSNRQWLALVACVLLPGLACAELVPTGVATFTGSLQGTRDLSAVQRLGAWLTLVSDENAMVQFLQPVGDHEFQFSHALALLPDTSAELDLEALALDGTTLYALGSHSRYRRRVKPGASQRENERRFSQVAYKALRDVLYRIEIDPVTGQSNSLPEQHSLRALLDRKAVLQPFLAAPGKENGVDLEGMAAVDGQLYLGFRGPVLRHNYVPVLVLRFADIQDCATNPEPADSLCELRYLNLGGRGVRAMQSVTDGILLIAGPVGDGVFSYQLYFWDGRDCFPRPGRSGCRLMDLGVIPGTSDAGAEGLTVLAEDATSWDILIVYDGVEGGRPTRFRIPRPEG